MTRLAVATALAGVLACRQHDDEHVARLDLLRLFPSTEQGKFRTIELGGGAASAQGAGWSTGRAPTGERVALMTGAEASVRLGRGVREASRIVLRCGVLDVGTSAPALLGVRLDGRQLRSLRLGAGLTEHVVAVSGRFPPWGSGDLVLRASSARHAAIGCSSIRVEPPHADGRPRPTVAGHGQRERLSLPGGTRVDFYLRVPEDAELRARLLPADDDRPRVLRVAVTGDGGGERVVLETASDGQLRADLVAFAKAVVRVSVEAVGEGTVRLERPRLLGAAPRTVQARAAPPRPLNLLLVVVDTLRADHLGCYGHERPTSPHIDALAAEGLLFTRAVAQSSWTTPATASILTGRYPHHHRAVTFTSPIAPDVPTLAELLRARGYRTGAYVTNVNVRGSLGFDRGFDDYHYYPEKEASPSLHLPASELAVHAASWLAAGDGRPFFLWVHASDPHAPYAAPPALAARFAEALPPTMVGSADPLRLLRRRGVPASAAELAYLTSLYDADVAAADEGVGHILAVLRQLRLAEDTLIIVTADHGEEFGEHGGFEHGHSLYRELTDIPLIIRLPGAARPGRVSTFARQVDIVPTALDVLGLPTPPTDGRPLLSDDRVDDTVEALSHAALHRVSRAAIETPRWKAIRTVGLRGDVVEVYDRRADPREQHDVAWERPVIAGYARQTIGLWPLDVAGSAARWPDNVRKMDRETVRRLRALGYLR